MAVHEGIRYMLELQGGGLMAESSHLTLCMAMVFTVSYL